MLSLGVDFQGCILETLPTDTWYQEVRVEIKYGHTLKVRFLVIYLSLMDYYHTWAIAMY